MCWYYWYLSSDEWKTLIQPYKFTPISQLVRSTYYNITELAKKLWKDEYMALLSSLTVSLDVIRYQVWLEKGSAKLGTPGSVQKKRSIYYCFQRIGSSTKSITAEQLQKVEEFVCVLYGVPQGSLASIKLRKFQNSYRQIRLDKYGFFPYWRGQNTK